MTAKKKGESSPNSDNPTNVFKIFMFEAIFTGLVFAALKYGDAENRLKSIISGNGIVSGIELDGNKATMLVVLLAGILQNHMAATTNWARSKYNVPWPNTFAPDGHKVRSHLD